MRSITGFPDGPTPILVALAAVLLSPALACGQPVAIVSDFSASADGWNVADLHSSGGPYDPPIAYYSVTWAGSGGDPGGCISAADPSNNSYFFNAPARFLGDRSAYFIGRLTFSLRTTHSTWLSDAVVVLVGGGHVIVAPISPSPATTWTRYSIRLRASSFLYNNLSGAGVTEPDFLAVLSNLTALRICAEYGSAVQETSGLDEVCLIPPAPSAIPADAGAGSLTCHPNPFNPRTTIRFALPAAGPVRLAVYDVGGRLVRILADGNLAAGPHEAVWDGRDATGRAMASGSYLARLEAGGKVEVVRASLIR